jgi:hypothetical protein
MFKSSKLTENIRKKYNYLKHRGTFEFEGLGVIQKCSMASVNGVSLPFLRREEIDIKELETNLIEFDMLFVEYFNILIEMIMPANFTKIKMDLFDPLTIFKKYKEGEII